MPGLLVRPSDCSRESSCDSIAPSLHHRRFSVPLSISLPHPLSLHRKHAQPQTMQPAPAVHGLGIFGLPNSTPSKAPERQSSDSRQGRSEEDESDAECWRRMLLLQKEYHCYKSARMEAAVEALENGWSVEEVPVPSRFCLDLLNEELRMQIEAGGDGYGI